MNNKNAINSIPKNAINEKLKIDAHMVGVEPAFQKQLEEKINKLWDAIRAYRDAKGRFQTQKACEHLLTLLPENQPEPPTEENNEMEQ